MFVCLHFVGRDGIDGAIFLFLEQPLVAALVVTSNEISEAGRRNDRPSVHQIPS